MLKKPCPYHKTPVNHTLEQCDMLKRFYGRAAAKDDEAKKDGRDGDAGSFPAVENVFLIFGGPTVDMSSRQRKRERHEVLAAEKAPPSFLDWSEDAITFSREDHPNRIPNPGQYPLVVDPVIENARFSKVLMDGGSSLNILYAHTVGNGSRSCRRLCGALGPPQAGPPGSPRSSWSMARRPSSPQTWSMGRPEFGAMTKTPTSEPVRTRWTNWMRHAPWP
jgi:hypothetical protein